MKKTFHLLAASLLAACMMPAMAQTKPTCELKSDAKLTSAAVSTGTSVWWPKTTEQPTGGYVEVARAGAALRQVPLVFVAPTASQIKAGTAPDAVKICFPMFSLRDGDILTVVTTKQNASTRSTPCQFFTGDAFTFRDYTPVGGTAERQATIKARIVPVGKVSGICTTTKASSTTPPPVVVVPDPPVTPPPVTPPATKTWAALVSEWQSFDRGTALVRYGVPGSWREVQVDGYRMCSASGLGLDGFDPAPGSSKACEILQ